ncbi:TonB-dependent receptor [Rugamonas apoptosis]|uniref:TonB-dependent receptor n=1 Tax=Rugamonas apoptosis TaxID=2758570 RepID=A0A7W2IJZ8_9BURK|nr:TonB-dependent receptor [Rugamonas apoptosis]MBA5687034.1 TonB-dependent receptor [Rugamonas apoptosis]
MPDHTSFKKTAITTAVLLAQAGGAAAQAPSTNGQIQEVIVTAQRVAQPASKTPIALSVVSGDELKAAGAVNASNLTELVPNVQISNNGGATVISIRGVSSADTTEKGDPSAAFNIDGVNLARPQSAGLAFYDLERVEVLRGPQGTLYGRNATAGAINLITNKPADKFESSAAIELGNYADRKFDGMVNSKVNSVLAIRAAVAKSQHDGYIRSTQHFAHDYDDDDSLSGRLQASLKFTPDLALLLSADASTLKGAGPGTVLYDTVLHRTGSAQRTDTPSVPGTYNNRARGTSAELKANLAVGELTYQVAHRNYDRDEIAPIGEEVAGVVSADSTTVGSYTQTSHELRLASAFGAWKTIGGLYLFKERSAIDARLRHFPDVGLLVFAQDPTISKSRAAFGEATLSIAPGLHVMAGLRRTFDDKSRLGQTIIGDPPFYSSTNDASVSYAQTTGRVGIDYLLAKDTMLYTTLSTGYKAGGFNDGTTATNPYLQYDPEHLTALEAGIKGRFLNNRLQVNANIFAYDYKDLQLTTVINDPLTGAPLSQTLNAAKASVTGAELEGKFVVSESGRLNFSATYLDAHFKNYMPNATSNWAGLRLAKSPKATLGLSYSHQLYLESGASLSGTIGTHYSSSYVLNDYVNAEQITQPAYHLSDANLSYAPASDKWMLQAYVRNITNKTVITDYAAASSGYAATVSLAAPRTAGVRLTAYFQ